MAAKSERITLFSPSVTRRAPCGCSIRGSSLPLESVYLDIKDATDGWDLDSRCCLDDIWKSECCCSRGRSALRLASLSGTPLLTLLLLEIRTLHNGVCSKDSGDIYVENRPPLWTTCYSAGTLERKMNHIS
ncbi:uncharacterized protein LOC111780101 [Cucurbita pepo subsp. pepo]|uniref:uncharacterized protein LOC111780101 n=1 Tax=Cucurbita pepo subsp. pepo TaxID=3664 RepID=UPI000C9D55A4|nr:uncharacterized protein LOC111780101 [Cucurbita pepo subsp. pepo]